MSSTKQIEDMTKDELIQFYKVLAEGWQALAEASFAQLTQTIVTASEGMSAMQQTVTSSGGKVSLGADAMRKSAVAALLSTFPDLADMPAEQQSEAIKAICQGRGLGL